MQTKYIFGAGFGWRRPVPTIESALRRTTMETFGSRVETLLGGTPQIYDFGLAQSASERQSAIRALSTHAARAILDIIVRMILDGYTLDEPQKNLAYLMDVEDWDREGDGDESDEIHPCSGDWRLRVFEHDGDVLYDFNGWPGDNESGAGVFYAAENSENPIDVFLNGDEDLVAASDEFGEIVDDYASRRSKMLETAVHMILDETP
jgi:hypothetical protein